MALDTVPEVPETTAQAEKADVQVEKAENAQVVAFHALPAREQMRERLRMATTLGARAFYPYTAPEAKVEWLTRCVRATLAHYGGRTVQGVLTEVAYSVAAQQVYLTLITDFDDETRETLYADEVEALYPPRPDAHLLAFTGRAPRERKTRDGQPARERKPRVVGPRIANVIDLNAMFGDGQIDLNALQALLNKHRAKVDAEVAAAPVADPTDDDRDDPYADDPEVQALRASMAVNRAAAARDEAALASSMDDYDALKRGETVVGVNDAPAVSDDEPVVYATDDAAMAAAFDAPIAFIDVDDAATPAATPAKVTTAKAATRPAPKPSASKKGRK